MPQETHIMNKRTPPKKRQSDFRLPRGVSMHKELLPSGWAYVLRHKELGLLGRLILHGLPSGHCQVSCEVAGDPADPLTAQRRAVLEPVTTALVRRLEAQTSTVQGVPWGSPPPSVAEPGQCPTAAVVSSVRALSTTYGGCQRHARRYDVKCPILPAAVTAGHWRPSLRRLAFLGTVTLWHRHPLNSRPNRKAWWPRCHARP